MIWYAVKTYIYQWIVWISEGNGYSLNTENACPNYAYTAAVTDMYYISYIFLYKYNLKTYTYK